VDRKFPVPEGLKRKIDGGKKCREEKKRRGELVGEIRYL
jgi:hypothetical protein